MSDIIRLLPDSVANQIAAGEVVKRPASVIKELVENAADAGATRIDIYIKDGGRTLIQVIDNGKGMSPSDARMAFERHATSKITEASDLFNLHTMGFRGEALPSICAVAQVELRTRQHDQTMGTRLLIHGSKVMEQEADLCEAGTNIAVRNLFYNVPARRKFMRSDSVETGYILREFERMALVNNNIHLTINTGSKVVDLRPANFRMRISDIWKNNLNSQLIGVDVETELVKIHGYVTRPEFARRRNYLQFMIANGRNMYHPKFHKAILTAFDSLIANDTQPCYFLKIDVDPATVDVNIHPTKNEIKFEYEQQIWSILHAAVKASLGKSAAVPAIDFSDDVLPVAPVDVVGKGLPEFESSKDYNPFENNKGNVKDWEKLYDDFMGNSKRSTDTRRVDYPCDNLHHGEQFGTQPASFVDNNVTSDFNPNASFEIEFNSDADFNEKPLNNSFVETSDYIHHPGGYIVTVSRSGILVIDQHRAHVRILFEKMLSRLGDGEIVSQTMMFPEVMILDTRQMAVFDEVKPDLEKIGFSLQLVGEKEVHLKAVPTMFGVTEARDVVLGFLDGATDMSAKHGVLAVGEDAMRSKMALIMARSAALKRTQSLSVKEMEHLVGELFSLPNPAYTPDGNAVYKIIEPEKFVM